jgi:RimJ/RimL family protein N-acetyltransferase
MLEHPLTPDTATLKPLLHPLTERHGIVQAVLDGTSPGTVWVDHATSPTAAFLHTAEGRFLVGDPTHAAFNQALHHHFQLLYEGSHTEWEEEVVLYCHPDGWATTLRETILSFRPPFISERLYYRFHAPRFTWRDKIPADMGLHPIDADMLAAAATLTHIRDLDFWITKNWGTHERFLAQGTGLCLMQGEMVVAWALTDCVSGMYCEIGVDTDVAYRRYGYGTLVTAALVERCIERGWTEIGWHCWAHNLGSIGVAEAAGFVRDAAYPAYVSLYDPLMHLAVQGYAALTQENFATAAQWYGQVAAQEDAPAWAFYQLARALAMTNPPEAALENLRLAVEHGWDDSDHAATTPHFASLRTHPAWQPLLAQMKLNGTPI